MNTIKTLITTLTFVVGITAQAQHTVTVKTDKGNETFPLNHRVVLDLSREKPEVRSGQENVFYENDTWMQIFITPADNTYELTDGMASVNVPEDVRYTKITYTRDFIDTNWQILYLPLSISYEEWSQDFDVAKLNDIHQFDRNNDGEIDETALEVIMLKGGSTEPNTPYVIRAHEAGTKTITQTDATLYATTKIEHTLSNWDTYFTVKGTYRAIDAGSLDSNMLYNIKENILQPGHDNDRLDAMRWYVMVTDRNGGKTKVNKIRIYEQGEGCTGIEMVEESTGNGPIYDLSGRRVNRPTKGIYIKDGKKLILK